MHLLMNTVILKTSMTVPCDTPQGQGTVVVPAGTAIETFEIGGQMYFKVLAKDLLWGDDFKIQFLTTPDMDIDAVKPTTSRFDLLLED